MSNLWFVPQKFNVTHVLDRLDSLVLHSKSSTQSSYCSHARNGLGMTRRSDRALILVNLMLTPVRRIHLPVVISLKLVQHRLRQPLSSQDVLLDPIGSHRADLILHVRARRHGEDVVELLERALFGLGQPEEDHEEGEGVEGGVESECTYGKRRISTMRLTESKDTVGLPCGFNALSMSGNVRDSTAAQKLLVATAHDMPTSRCESGKTSAE